MKIESDLVIKNANEIATVSGFSKIPAMGSNMQNLGVIKGGWIAVDNGKIVFVGKQGEAEDCIEINERTKIIDAKGMVIIPGLIDAHSHALFNNSRKRELSMRIKGHSYLEVAKQGGGILKTVEDTRQSTLKELVDATRERLDKMLSNGTTTIEIKSGYGLNVASEIKMLKAVKILQEQHTMTLVPTFLGAHDFPAEYKQDNARYIEIVAGEMLPLVQDSHLAKFCDVFCENGVFSKKQSRIVLEKAKELGLSLKLHADELCNSGGTRLAAELKATSADHVCYANDEDIKMLKKSETVAVLLPVAPFLLMAKKYADARKLIEEGIPVALGSDFSPGSSITSMITIICLGCLEMCMYPEEAIIAATINAAHALELGQQIGSIEVGKEADLVILNIESYDELPYTIGENVVHLVIKGGQVVFSL
jgi:imidazolonepropionase